MMKGPDLVVIDDDDDECVLMKNVLRNNV